MRIRSQKIPDSHALESSSLDRLLRRRKLQVALILIVAFVVFLALNLGSWLFLNRMSHHLDRELGKRLISTAVLAAELVEAEVLEDLLPTPDNRLSLLFIQDKLREIRRKHELEGAYIIDRNYQTLIDSYAEFFPGLQRTYLQADSLYVKKAWLGIPSASPLHTLGDAHFKTAYAPVHNPNGEVVGVLVTEANAHFFSLLAAFRKTLILFAIGSLGVLLLFSIFLIWAVSLLFHTQELLQRSERLAAMGQMAAVVAHEIRNPLGIIKGTADILKSKYNNPQKPDELFDYIPAEVNRLSQLVYNFLAFARDRPLNLQRTHLENMVTRTLQEVQRNFPKGKIRFHYQSNSPIPPFYLDEDAIKQVLLNILKNACESIPHEGDVTLTTAVIERNRRSFASIEVRDTGTGIEGDPNRIFEPFYTTKASGTGLGMAVSKKIVERHGGWIEVESQKGQGTRVCIYLPLRQDIADKKSNPNGATTGGSHD